jgi:hypothetical protein
VRFRVSDVFLPNPEEVCAGLSVSTEAEGTIINFSDSGAKPRAYAVVEVVRRQNVVIPIEKLEIITSA